MPTVTYSPEDNKIRLYVGRVPRDEYERLRDAGFVSTPKQSCDFVAVWTPQREDIAREYLDDDEDIEDEDYSPAERAADRAERFEGYRGKRLDEATTAADRYESGPQVIGHQSEARANRIARRLDRTRRYAASQWSKAEYWRDRTAGVIRHALHKQDPKTRRRRILTLEAEQRKHDSSRNDYAKTWEAWMKVLNLAGADEPVVIRDTSDHIGIDMQATSLAGRLAYSLACDSLRCWQDFTHPRTGKTADLYHLMRDTADPITAGEAARLWLENATRPDDEESYSARMSRHYALRLQYENAMLENEGGKAADIEMIPGGFIGTRQIQAINKSPVTGRVVSVKVFGPRDWWNGPGPAPIVLKTINIEDFGANIYRAPTDEELSAFKAETATRKAEEKAKKPAPVKLINPTDEDAQKLQDIWNEQARKKSKSADPVQVERMTQAEYTNRSKGTYAQCETVSVDENTEIRRFNRRSRVEVFKVRTADSRQLYGAQRVVILTDKPQTPIPWEAIETARASCPTVEQLAPRIEEIKNAHYCMNKTAEMTQLCENASYVGILTDSRYDVPGLTELGKKLLQEHNKRKAEAQATAPTPTEKPARKELALF